MHRILRMGAGEAASPPRPWHVFLAALVVFAVGAFGPAGIREGDALSLTPAPPGTAHQGHTMAPAVQNSRSPTSGSDSTGARNGVDLTASDFAFDRRELRTARGQPVRLVLRNQGKLEHDFVIPGLQADVLNGGRHGPALHVHALPGQSDVVEFVPLIAGNFEAVCTIPGHAQAGMKVQVSVVN